LLVALALCVGTLLDKTPAVLPVAGAVGLVIVALLSHVALGQFDEEVVAG
jgi:hypothetical protein